MLSFTMSIKPRGRRAPGLVALCLLLLSSAGLGCQTLRLEEPNDDPDSWRMEGYTPQRRNAVAASLQPPMEEVWAYGTGGGFGAGSPLLLNNSVIVATQEGGVHAISIHDGDRISVGEFGDAIEGSPVLQDDLLFVPIAKGDEAIVSYDLPRGAVQWSKEGPPIETSPLSVRHLLVAIDRSGDVIAWEARSGHEQWRQSFGKESTVHGAPVAPTADEIVFADENGTVRELSTLTGELVWERTLPAPVYTTPAANDSTVFVSTTRGQLHAVSTLDGSTRWRFAVPDSIVRLSTPAVGSTHVFVGGSDGRLRALGVSDGEVHWTFDAKEALASAPLLAGNTVFAGSMDGTLYALDAGTGQVQWHEQLEGRIRSTMAAGPGRLVVLSEPDEVRLFRPSSSTATYAERPLSSR